ncbi:unnamed protein product [Cochlearia groenlandica]
MSRCFPFPPPGYEKKIIIDEAESLAKEKQKMEKKHKKEKKDKEKREGKEKRDKETSKDKHKERKEKKEKHKDRKDKDRDKEKSRTPRDNKAAGVLPNTGDREKLLTNNLQNNGNGESKFIHDLERRIRNEEEATESQSARKFDLTSGVTESNISCPVPQSACRKDDEKRINTQRNSAMAKRSENAVLRVPSCTDQRGAEVIAKIVEKKDLAKKTELEEKNHRRESMTKIDKPLVNEGIKKSEAKNLTDRSSKEKKEENTEVINKTGLVKQKFVEGGPRLKEREHDSLDTKNLTVEGILGKRKDLETNGLLYENGSRPNKILRPVASLTSSVQNGRKLGASQTLPKPTSVLQETVSNPEVKERRVNGFIDPQEPKSHPPVSSMRVKENGEASAKKRPHSDFKYLDQILSVPKRKELDDDEQEWLFVQPSLKLLKKQITDSTPSLDETPQVWNQALRIDSADIIALPYVVPL